MFRHRKQQRCSRGFIIQEGCISLCQAAPGSEVVIRGYDGLAVSQRSYLQAYGMLPGRCVRILAQRPVTIIQIEETELAFEPQIAETILVDS